MGKQLVSIIIPTFSRPDNLCRAIDSVLAQTYHPIEIIVVDDNGIGTPFQLETEKVLEDLLKDGRIVYLKHETNRNGSAARNTGFRAAKGEYVNFLDDDDIFLPEKIERQVAYLQEKEGIFQAVTCNTKVIGRKRSFITKNKKEGNLISDVLSGKMNFNTSSVLFCSEAVKTINGFDESFNRHQDWELYIRFFRLFKMGICQDVLLHKLQTTNILSRNPLKAIEYKQKFLDAFKYDIEKMGHPHEIYKYQYEVLALYLLIGGCKKEGIYYMKKAFSYGFPNFYSLMKYIYYLSK